MAPGPQRTKAELICFCLTVRLRYGSLLAAMPVAPQQPCQQQLSTALLSQPYIPKDPPVVRVTEGPLFSEVASYYQHVQIMVRLYNVPGETRVAVPRQLLAWGEQPLTACLQGWRACPWR